MIENIWDRHAVFSATELLISQNYNHGVVEAVILVLWELELLYG